MFSKNSNTVGGWNLNPVPSAPCVATPVTGVGRQNLNANAIYNSVFPAFFGTAQSVNPLPVELLSFDAVAQKSDILTRWTTAGELNNKGFEIERSLNATEFTKIGWADGFGTTNKVHDYSFADKKVLPDVIYYYRLKQTDLNGEFSYSPVVAASVNDNTVLFTVNPNPYSGKTKISYVITETSNVSIEVINTLGQKITILFNGQQEAEVAANTMKFGAYDYIVKNESAFQRLSLVLNNISGHVSTKKNLGAQKFFNAILLIIVIATIVGLIYLRMS